MSSNCEGPVVIFDSGLGGLSVLRAFRKSMPDRRYIYLADEAYFPYGGLEESQLGDRVMIVLDAAIQHFRPALVVIACNTASTLVLPRLRSRHQLPFVGTVPAIKPAAEITKTGLISVLATPATISRDYTRTLIDQHARDAWVRLVGAPDLAALAEAELSGRPAGDEHLRSQIAPCFHQRRGARTDIVVLACTHFPLIMDRLAALAPWPVTWLDPAPAIARHGASLLPDVAQSREADIFVSTGPADSVRPLLLQEYSLSPSGIDLSVPNA